MFNTQRVAYVDDLPVVLVKHHCGCNQFAYPQQASSKQKLQILMASEFVTSSYVSLFFELLSGFIL